MARRPVPILLASAWVPRLEEPDCPTQRLLRQLIQITGATRRLLRWCGRVHPRRIVEVEELRHVHLSGIALGQWFEAETRFDQLQDCGVIRNGVVYVVLSRVRR